MQHQGRRYQNPRLLKETEGTKYMVISSETRVTAEAKLVDLRSGATLWSGAATASSAEGDNNSGGLIAMLVTAAIRQIVETISSKGL